MLPSRMAFVQYAIPPLKSCLGCGFYTVEGYLLLNEQSNFLSTLSLYAIFKAAQKRLRIIKRNIFIRC